MRDVVVDLGLEMKLDLGIQIVIFTRLGDGIPHRDDVAVDEPEEVHT